MLVNGRSDPVRQIALTVVVSLLVFTFLGAIEKPASGVGWGTPSLASSKVNRLSGDYQAASVIAGAVQSDPPVVHASFLLFDFKQNLRRWPVVAGDINRSPPFLPNAKLRRF
jgi:hypothetical protein